MKPKYIPTGNEYISLPCIEESNAALLDFTFLHMRYKGLIDVRGDEERPLLKPVIIKEGVETELVSVQWDCKNDWIPTFTARAGELLVSGIILTPIQERGFIYQLTIKNPTEAAFSLSAGFEGTWVQTSHSINEDKVIDAPRYVYQSGWNDSLVFDLRIGVSVFAFAPIFDQKMISTGNQEQDGTIHYRFVRELMVAGGESVTITSYWGIGFEEVAATTAAKEMLRQGFDHEFKNTVQWLSTRQRLVGDTCLNRILNKNLFFNLFYATGTTLDTEELVLVTSRSPRYYVSAAYWDRDSLLWSFPSVLEIDSEYAKEMLLYVYKKQIRNVGIHSRYIDGTVLEPGFELDELCAPVLALYNYVIKTDDRDILGLDCIKEGVEHILKILSTKRNASVALYETFLQPTDDIKLYPYITYDNVLVWKLFDNLITLYGHQWPLEKLEHYEKEKRNIYDAIYEHCVKEHEGRKIFAWSVDLMGHWDIYDEPPGSIQLFPHYGFCKFDNIIYQNTVKIIRRPDYPYSFHGCNIADIGCPHAPHPWVLSIANSLLCNRLDTGKDMLLKMKMDNGIACESVDETTGESTTGDAFATCAGFLSYAMIKAFGKS